MKFSLRRVHDNADCNLSEGNTSIYFGFIDHDEAKILLEEFKSAVDGLEWFVRATDKEQP
jgi:hypothetical protein